MFGRYSHAVINNIGFASTTNKYTWLFPDNYQLVEPNYAGNVTYTFTPHLVNEFNVGFSGWHENSLYNASDVAKVQLGASGFNLPSLYRGRKSAQPLSECQLRQNRHPDLWLGFTLSLCRCRPQFCGQ